MATLAFQNPWRIVSTFGTNPAPFLNFLNFLNFLPGNSLHRIRSARFSSHQRMLVAIKMHQMINISWIHLDCIKSSTGDRRSLLIRIRYW